MHDAPATQNARALAPPRGRAIHALPQHVVNQIAAGEVVERPASVVKELLDNALDAAATRIRIELERGGADLVRVVDDGAGVAADELPLALAPHATSKIEKPEDLVGVATMGFRGEALASIASVSRLTFRSRTQGADAAFEVAQEGDRAGAVKPAGGPAGTSVTVRDLFFNAPARRAFLRTPATEQGRCVDVVRNAAMAFPLVAFVCMCDARVVMELPAMQGPNDRLLALVGKDLASDLIEVRAEPDETGGVGVWGLAGTPASARATARWQRIFVNGRPVRDATLAHALKEAYRGLIEPAKRPVAMLLVEVDPREVDVNVHPAKAEVRFHDPGKVHAAILRAVRDALSAADLTPAWPAHASRDNAAAASAPRAAVDPQQFVEQLRAAGLAPASPGGFDYEELRSAVETARDADAPADESATSLDAVEARSGSRAIPIALPAPQPADRFLQVHNSYLVTQDETGVVIIDQHALHERIMFEKLLARVHHGPLESQRLLAPAIFSATIEQVGALPGLAPLLTRLGVDAQPIGPADVAVHAFPTLLFERKVDPAPFVRDLLDRACADDFPADKEEALRDVLDMMACKAAVKAGERLSDDEMAELLALRDNVDRASNCPHGRPTTIRLSIHDLEKQFGRT